MNGILLVLAALGVGIVAVLAAVWLLRVKKARRSIEAIAVDQEWGVEFPDPTGSEALLSGVTHGYAWELEVMRRPSSSASGAGSTGPREATLLRWRSGAATLFDTTILLAARTLEKKGGGSESRALAFLSEWLRRQPADVQSLLALPVVDDVFSSLLRDRYLVHSSSAVAGKQWLELASRGLIEFELWSREQRIGGHRPPEVVTCHIGERGVELVAVGDGLGGEELRRFAVLGASVTAAVAPVIDAGFRREGRANGIVSSPLRQFGETSHG